MKLVSVNQTAIFPLLLLCIGGWSAIITLFYYPALNFTPNIYTYLLTALLSIAAFLTQRFYLCGVSLGLLAFHLWVPAPYTQTFPDCTYQATISQANYSRSRQGQAIKLSATHIICKTKASKQQLPNQVIQFWDNKNQLTTLSQRSLTLRSELSPIRARLNPYHIDYEKHLISQGIRLTANHLTILKQQPLTHPILFIKNRFSAAIQTQLSPSNAAILLALITGNRSALTPQQKQTMQQTGTSHLLAISGLHLALVGGLAWLVGQGVWAFFPLLSTRLMPIQAGAMIALIIITFYAVLTGFDVPVRRAWIMFSLMILSWLWLKSFSTHSLLIAALAVMLTDPYAVISVGFYFSFLATFMVLWSARLPYAPMTKIIIMQLLITLTLLPITWYAFGIISLSAFFVNLLVIPWLGLWVLPWAILACLISLISIEAAAPIWSWVDWTTTALWQVIAAFEQFNGTLSPAFRPTRFATVIAVFAILTTLANKKYYALLGLLLLFIPWKQPTAPALIIADSRYTSSLIHNGQTALIINPGRHYRTRNDAEKWLRYLNNHQLTLTGIVLQDTKISKISATAFLIKHFPKAQVITLTQQDLPYPHNYCQPLALPNVALVTTVNPDNCHATLHWFGKNIELFPDSDVLNSINPRATLVWDNKTYNTQRLGAVTVEYQNNTFRIDYLRQTPTAWRHVVARDTVSN